jgi:uncharacterized protein (UPF0335 family)
MTESNSTTVTKGFVDRFENLFRAQESITADLSELSDEVKEAGISPKDAAAIKAIAKLRVGGKEAKAKEKLEAMHRVAEAMEMDLFRF